MDSAPNHFILPEKLHNATYKRLERFSFQGASPQLNPIAIILGGQPGSGKSGLLNASYEEIPNRNAVMINGDDFRQWHPYIKQIRMTDEANMAALTDPDVRPWTKRLFDTSISTKRNIIFEGTMRNTGPISETMGRLRNEGFHVIARVIATHERQSVVGIHSRFETQKRDGHGRMAPLSVHNEAYSGVLDTIDHIEKNNLADRIQIFNRAGQVIHDAALIDGSWSIVGARNAIENERSRKPSLDECRIYLQDWEYVLTLMQERKAPLDELKLVMKLAAEHINGIYEILVGQESLSSRAIDAARASMICNGPDKPLQSGFGNKASQKNLRNQKKNDGEGDLDR